MSLGKYTLNAAGEPELCDDVLEWGRWMETARDQTVAQTMVGDVKVSTVFLGLDHNFGRGAPLLYETMVFGGPHDQWQDRYSTRAEAEAGHAAAVAMVQGGGA